MLGACVKAANSVAGVAVPVEIEYRREASSMSCSISLVVQQPGYQTKSSASQLLVAMLSHAAFPILPLSFEITLQTLDHFQVVSRLF